jgi:hypothetical protein
VFRIVQYPLPIGLSNPLTDTGISDFLKVLLIGLPPNGGTNEPDDIALVASSISSSSSYSVNSLSTNVS